MSRRYAQHVLSHRGLPGRRIVASAVDAYGAAQALSGLLAHWRFADAGSVVDSAVGARHGTYDVGGEVTLVAGLPAGSNQASRLPGTVKGTVEHDAGLELAAWTLSMWCVVHTVEDTLTALVTKEQAGLNDGDFGLYCNDAGELYAQLQSTTAQHQALGIVAASGQTYHAVVTADSTGLSIWIDGQFRSKNTGFTGAWSSNTNDLIFAGAPQFADRLDCSLDEVALYNRVLTDAEIIGLSQVTALPVAGDASGLTVDEDGGTVTIDVAAASAYVGRKEDLIITLGAEEAFGTASVNGSNDIVFTADAVTANEADTFTYTITDVNGESTDGTVSLTVIDAGETNPGGGTLVYDFQPQASWIDGVALADRDTDDAIGIIGTGTQNAPADNKWDKDVAGGGGAVVGASLVRGTNSKNNNTSDVCWNRAPTGDPSLELHVHYPNAGVHNIADFAIELYEPLTRETTGPAHIRVVMETRICKSTDPTTYKANGLGTTGGSYPDFVADVKGTGGMKYFCSMYQGNNQEGPIFCHWWSNTNPRVAPGSYGSLTNIGYMTSCGSSGLALELGNYDRPSYVGEWVPSSGANINDEEGCWTRHELEVRLTSPASVPANSFFGDGDPNPHSADGFMRMYITHDIDGELGTPGTRQQVAENAGVLCNPKNSDRHLNNNLVGPWLDFYFGGSTFQIGEGWAWVRRIQVYRHD
jgi:hypothetical protein